MRSQPIDAPENYEILPDYENSESDRQVKEIFQKSQLIWTKLLELIDKNLFNVECLFSKRHIANDFKV